MIFALKCDETIDDVYLRDGVKTFGSKCDV